MPQLSLSIAPDYFASDGFLEVELLMFWSTHQFDILDEHAKVCHSWDLVRVD